MDANRVAVFGWFFEFFMTYGHMGHKGHTGALQHCILVPEPMPQRCQARNTKAWSVVLSL
jgi:hypothetical protein